MAPAPALLFIVLVRITTVLKAAQIQLAAHACAHFVAVLHFNYSTFLTAYVLVETAH